MIKNLALLIFLLISTALSVAYHVPTSWLLQQASLPKALKINNVSGKLWHGQADNIKWKQWTINNPTWDLSLSDLLKQNANGDITGQIFDANFNSQIEVNQQTLIANNGYYKNQIQQLLKHLKLNLVDLTGKIEFKLKHLNAKVTNQQIEQINLTTIWHNARINSPLKLNLGQVTAKTKMVDNKIITKINGVSGDININGTITISPNQNFITKITLRPTKKLTDDIKLTLRLVAKEMPNGDYFLNKKGNLRYLF